MKLRLLVVPFLCCLVVACSTDKEDWANAEGANTIAAYEMYLEQHPQGLNADNAHARIEELSWQDAVTANTIETFEAFIRRYPDSQHVSSAEDSIEDIKYSVAAAAHTLEAYEGFLAEYPDSSHKGSIIAAMEQIELQAQFDRILQDGDIEGFRAFMLDNPASPLLDQYRFMGGTTVLLESQPTLGKRDQRVVLKASDKAGHLDYLLTVPPDSPVDLGFDATVTIVKGSMKMAIREGGVAGYFSADEETTLLAQIKSTGPVGLIAEKLEIAPGLAVCLAESEFLVAGQEGAVIKRNLTASEFVLERGSAYYVVFRGARQ